MAYLRGDNYVWSDDKLIHIWAKNGYDGWDLAGWATTNDEPYDRHPDRTEASGVSISLDVFDELVMMRLGQIISEGRVDIAIDRALESGNFGANELEKRAEEIKVALANVAK